MTGPKERVCDEKINPIALQLLNVCKDAGINFIATFELDDDDEGVAAYATTMLLKGDASPRLRAAAEVVLPEYKQAAILQREAARRADHAKRHQKHEGGS